MMTPLMFLHIKNCLLVEGFVVKGSPFLLIGFIASDEISKCSISRLVR